MHLQHNTESQITPCEKNDKRPQAFVLDLAPVVSSFSKHINVRRKSKLPFGAMSFGSEPPACRG